MQVQMVESVLSDVSDSKSRVLLDLSLLRQSFTLLVKDDAATCQHANLIDDHFREQRSLTVNSLIKVDFPAPLGPRIPTRLLNDKAHETSTNEGLAAPS